MFEFLKASFCSMEMKYFPFLPEKETRVSLADKKLATEVWSCPGSARYNLLKPYRQKTPSKRLQAQNVIVQPIKTNFTSS